MTKLRLSRTLLPEKRLAVLCAVPAVLVVLALMTLLAGCSDKEPWKNLSQEQKIEDFEYLFDILEYTPLPCAKGPDRRLRLACPQG